MFKIKYTYQDGGPSYKAEYPGFENENNFFLIRGTNDQGKTTSLNMVALGLHAHKLFKDDNNIIPDTLKAKIDYFQSGKLDEISFDFEIVSRDEKTRITSQFFNNTISSKLNNQIVGSDELMQYIQLLYDIPDDPIIKLNSTVKIIKENLIDYGKYLERYKDKIQFFNDRINDYKNREERKLKLERKLQKDSKNLDTKNEQLQYVNAEIEKYSKYLEVHKAYEIEERIQENNDRIKYLKEIRTDLVKKGVTGKSKKFKEKLDEYDAKRSEAIRIISEIDKKSSFLSEEHQKMLKVIKNGLQRGREIQKIKQKDVDLWLENIDKIKQSIEDNDVFLEYKDETEQSELIDKLLEVLRSHLSTQFKIPGTDQESVFKFYKILDDYQKELKPKISKVNALKIVKEELSRLAVDITDYNNKRIDIPEITGSDFSTFEDAETSIKKLEREIEKLEIEYTKYADTISQLSDTEINLILQESHIEDELNNRIQEKGNLDKEISTLNLAIPSTMGSLKELEISHPHPNYSEDWLKYQFEMCEKLQRKIENWKQILNTINLKKGDLGVDYEKSKEFLDKLSEFFADILIEVHFEQKSWKVNKVDLIERQYIVEGRPPIKFIQMGTGHTALNSILSRIKQKFPKKKKIILIDEIGHMDERNIGKLRDEIITQIKSGETILALMTIADNNVSKPTWEPIY